MTFCSEIAHPSGCSENRADYSISPARWREHGVVIPGYQRHPLPCRSKARSRHATARVTQASAATHSTQASQGCGGTTVQQRHHLACALAGTPAARSPCQAG